MGNPCPTHSADLVPVCLRDSCHNGLTFPTVLGTVQTHGGPDTVTTGLRQQLEDHPTQCDFHHVCGERQHVLDGAVRLNDFTDSRP